MNVLGFQAWEIGENIFGGISPGQAGEHGAQRDARALEDRLAAADSFIADDALFVVFPIADCAARGTYLSLVLFILSSAAVFVPIPQSHGAAVVLYWGSKSRLTWLCTVPAYRMESRCSLTTVTSIFSSPLCETLTTHPVRSET